MHTFKVKSFQHVFLCSHWRQTHCHFVISHILLLSSLKQPLRPATLSQVHFQTHCVCLHLYLPHCTTLQALLHLPLGQHEKQPPDGVHLYCAALTVLCSNLMHCIWSSAQLSQLTSYISESEVTTLLYRAIAQRLFVYDSQSRATRATIVMVCYDMSWYVLITYDMIQDTLAATIC